MDWDPQVHHGLYLTERVYKVVLQKSIPAQGALKNRDEICQPQASPTPISEEEEEEEESRKIKRSKFHTRLARMKL